MSEHPDAELASDAMKMATAVRGGRAVIDGVIFHTDRGSTYTANGFTKLCRKLGNVSQDALLNWCYDVVLTRASVVRASRRTNRR